MDFRHRLGVGGSGQCFGMREAEVVNHFQSRRLSLVRPAVCRTLGGDVATREVETGASGDARWRPDCLSLQDCGRYTGWALRAPHGVGALGPHGLGRARSLYWRALLCLSALALRLLGRPWLHGVLAPVVPLLLSLGSASGDVASRAFLRRAFAAAVVSIGQPGWWDGLSQFPVLRTPRAGHACSGGRGRMPADAGRRPAEILGARSTPKRSRAARCSSSARHGNVEVSARRYSTSVTPPPRHGARSHTRHAENYNRVLREFNPEAADQHAAGHRDRGPIPPSPWSSMIE